jgi:hypothetical protein
MTRKRTRFVMRLWAVERGRELFHAGLVEPGYTGNVKSGPGRFAGRSQNQPQNTGPNRSRSPYFF